MVTFRKSIMVSLQTFQQTLILEFLFNKIFTKIFWQKKKKKKKKNMHARTHTHSQRNDNNFLNFNILLKAT